MTEVEHFIPNPTAVAVSPAMARNLNENDIVDDEVIVGAVIDNIDDIDSSKNGNEEKEKEVLGIPNNNNESDSETTFGIKQGALSILASDSESTDTENEVVDDNNDNDSEMSPNLLMTQTAEAAKKK